MMDEEIQFLIRNNTWKLTPFSSGKNTIFAKLGDSSSPKIIHVVE